MSHVYSGEFYKYINEGSRKSAKVIVPFLFDQLQLSTVLDIGCGQGAWLRVWQEQGATDLVGIDGDYVDTDHFQIEAESFVPKNLSTGLFDLGRRFDIVQTLEVAEHLPKESSEKLVASLVKHGDIVMFSAALPGQGGENHINERSLDSWREMFARHEYFAFDYIRPLVAGNETVKPWYRYNTILYVHKDKIASLPDIIKEAAVPENQKIKDLSSIPWKLRRLTLLLLPAFIVKKLAQMNAAREVARANKQA